MRLKDTEFAAVLLCFIKLTFGNRYSPRLFFCLFVVCEWGKGARVCCFVLLTQYWGIVTVLGFFVSTDLR